MASIESPQKEHKSHESMRTMLRREPRTERPPIPTVRHSNSVYCASMGCGLDLRRIATRLRNAEYNVFRSSSLVLRWPSPRLSFRLYQRGRLLVLGAADVSLIEGAVKSVCLLLSEIGITRLRPTKLSCRSIAAKFSCGFPVRLDRLATDHPEFATYEPEVSSNLVYRFPGPVSVDQERDTQEVIPLAALPAPSQPQDTNADEEMEEEPLFEAESQEGEEGDPFADLLGDEDGGDDWGSMVEETTGNLELMIMGMGEETPAGGETSKMVQVAVKPTEKVSAPVVLVTVTGQCLVSGIQTLAEAQAVCDRLFPLLWQYS